MINFGAQNDPESGPLKPIFNTPLKVAHIDMYTKTDVKPVDNFLENDQRLEFLLILGPKVAQQLGLWGPNSPHIEKYLQWACEAILMWNQWPIARILTYFGAQNGQEIGPLRPISYTALKAAPMSI